MRHGNTQNGASIDVQQQQTSPVDWEAGVLFGEKTD